jgi:urease accessory protein
MPALVTASRFARLAVTSPAHDEYRVAMMRRASEIRAAGTWNTMTTIDRVVLDADERHRRRVVLTGERGTQFLLDLPQATALKDGDGLVLDDGSIVRVAGRPEPLIEIAAASPHELARLAWHLGNRHTDVQVVGEKLRIRRDHVLEDMLRRLGARLTPIDAPFDPEQGAYAHGHHHHGHAHGS